MGQETKPALSVRGLTVTFGGIQAVSNLDFDVPDGAIVSLIGPNGAGKTTALNAIGGFVAARGSVLLSGENLSDLPPHRRARLGLGRTFQNLQLFPSLTLRENLLVGGSQAPPRARVEETLQRLDIDRYAGRPAGTLPFGVQKLAGVARALAHGPRVLLLDEPAAGLNREETDTLGQLVAQLRRELAMSVLLVEHNMRLVMGISDRVVVLVEGRRLAEGLPAEVAHAPAVIAAYLGGDGSAAVAAGNGDESAFRA